MMPPMRNIAWTNMRLRWKMSDHNNRRQLGDPNPSPTVAIPVPISVSGTPSVTQVHGTVRSVGIEIHSPAFLDGIAVEPSLKVRIIKAAPEIEHPGVAMSLLRRKAIQVRLRQRTVHGYGISTGVIKVFGHDDLAGVD